MCVVCSDALLTTVIPLVSKCCQQAFSKQDETLTTLSQHFGKLCLGLAGLLIPSTACVCLVVLCEYSKFRIELNSYFGIRFDLKRVQLFEIQGSSRE